MAALRSLTPEPAPRPHRGPPPPPRRPRYEVVSIEGWGEKRSEPREAVWVADSCYGFRVVSMYRPNQKLSRATCHERARRRCAELNTEHETWMREHGYAGVA